MSDQLTGQTIGLLQTLIRNECVNDGTAESGHEVRSVDVLKSYLAGTGLAMEQFEPTPGRASLVARIEGYDPSARVFVSWATPMSSPRIRLAGVGIPRRRVGRRRGVGRGAVDMLNLTASMAVAVRGLADRDFARAAISSTLLWPTRNPGRGTVRSGWPIINPTRFVRTMR